MSSFLQTSMAKAAEPLSKGFAEEIVWLGDGNENRTIKAIVDDPDDQRREATIESECGIQVRTDATLGVADPIPGNRCTVRGRTCEVKDRVQGKHGWWRLTLLMGKES